MKTRTNTTVTTDFLIIGTGVAGLNYARKVAELGSVTIITKLSGEDSSSVKAQGGIAAVTAEEDSIESHVQDTLRAGAGICDEAIVRMTVSAGPALIGELSDLGVRFTKREEFPLEHDLGKEGGHSKRRIHHAEDLTGKEVISVLMRNVKSHSNVEILENHIAINLITTKKLQYLRSRFSGINQCLGAYALDIKNNRVITFRAKVTIISTGGCGKVYLYTSNPDIASGDGIAMAYRAGAEIANMEFVQFHPTCLFHPEAKSFLISEAVRGEGAVLRLKNGKAFMKKYHPLKELAPRDIVARAIDNELKTSGEECVFLDITNHSREFLKKRFPNIYRECDKFGFKMDQDLIPVVPAAHYLCGGILTDDKGATNIRGLYAIGEVACTGLHGANRLASNSLLEALVFSDHAAKNAKKELRDFKMKMPDIPEWDVGVAVDSDESVLVSQNWDEIRRFMWNYVGIVRSDKRLARAKKRIDLLQKEIREYYWNFLVTSDLIELRNIAMVAELIINCALKRKESRGLHYNIDHPQLNPHPKKFTTVVRK